MRLNVWDKCCCRYNKATGEVGGRVIFPLHLDYVLLVEGRWKSKWIQVCVYEMSVCFCQAAYLCILLSLHSSWVYKPSSSSDPAMSNYLSSTSFNHAGILHGPAVLLLPLLLELNVPYGFHLKKGLIPHGVAGPARWEVPAGALGSTSQLNCGSWGQVQKLVGWNLWPVQCRRSDERFRVPPRWSICAAPVLRCLGTPRPKLESLLAKIIAGKWYFKGGEHCKIAHCYRMYLFC